MHTVRREIVILSLFAIANDGRTCGFKSLNRVSDGIVVESIKIGIFTATFCDAEDEMGRSWDAPNWLGGNGDWRRLGHTYRLARSIIDLSGVNNNRSSGFPISSRKGAPEILP
jgi:hypothetical protein